MHSTFALMKNVFIDGMYKYNAAPSSPPTTPTERLQGIASSSQQRIWSDLLTSSTVHNIILPFSLKHGSMSIDQIQAAIVLILERHQIFRTAVYYNEQTKQLEQKVQPLVDKDAYSFQLTCNPSSSSKQDINALLIAESKNNFAQIERGLVFRCHLIKKTSADDVTHLHTGDLIVFTIHPIAFDVNSITPFVNAFTQAYDQSEYHVQSRHYLDFALYEHARLNDPHLDSKMNQSRRFWSTLMQGYHPHAIDALPLLSTSNITPSSGRVHSAVVVLDSNLVDIQMQSALSNNVSMFELGLACYFLFLYELTNGQITDWSVTIPTNNRSSADMNSVIGMFTNIVPFRITLEPNESFVDLLQRIHQLCLDVHEHARLPYQEIISANTIENNNSFVSTIPFHYECSSYGTTMEIKTKDATLNLSTMPDCLQNGATMPHDILLTFQHDPVARSAHYVFSCPADKYEESTLFTISERFQHLLTELFSSSNNTLMIDQLDRTEKIDDSQQTIFHRLPHLIHTGE